MIALTVGEVARIVDGRLLGADPERAVTGSVEFDSRLIQPGGLFLALPGAKMDGHDFTELACAAGAAASIVTRSVPAPAILVHDGLSAVAALAAEVIRRLHDVSIIGITGSSGKTSTKDVVAHLLSLCGPTVAPPESFNNELGYPYTVLRADEHTRYLVMETSARHVGHIRHLAQIATPRIGVVLNVGSAHLGEFGSREAIFQAKGELVEALPPDGVAILNADDPTVVRMATRTDARVVTVGIDPSADVRASDVTFDRLARASYTLCAGDAATRVSLQAMGEHFVGNSLAAAAVALECGMDLQAIAEALTSARPVSRWRMEATERADGVLIINDAYNANPESVRAALHALARVGAGRPGRTVAVLGPMAELGGASPAAHEAIGLLAAELGISRLIAFGEEARPIELGATRQRAWRGRAAWVPDADTATALLRAELSPEDVVLVKASRSAGAEKVALTLAGDAPSRPNGDRAAGVPRPALERANGRGTRNLVVASAVPWAVHAPPRDSAARGSSPPWTGKGDGCPCAS